MVRRANPWLVSGLVALAASLPYGFAFLANYRIVSASQMTRIFCDPFQGKPSVQVWEPLLIVDPIAVVPTPPGPAPGVKTNPTVAKTIEPDPIPASPLLEDPSHALQSFHEALARSEFGQDIVRICHFGDSPITGDLISGETRARFQRIYGDAGHGWILPGRPWEWYGHLGVTLEDEGWNISTPATNGRRDHAYGFGGASFSSHGQASTQLTTAKSSPFNQLEIHYLAQPKGGSLQIKVDGEVSVLSTRQAEPGPAVETLKLAEDTAHSVLLQSRGDGEVTLYGLVLERSTHGVVYDALGANGGAIHHLTLMDEANWIPSLKLRRPDLVILAFGTNESGYANIPGPGYDQDYRKIINRIREALPHVSILIMAPMDRAERSQNGEIVTMPTIPRIVAAQRKLALEMGCAFFNTYQAMGGEGSALRWYKVSPRLMAGDFTHPTRGGADRLACLFVESLRTRMAASIGPELKSPEGKP